MTLIACAYKNLNIGVFEQVSMWAGDVDDMSTSLAALVKTLLLFAHKKGTWGNI
jgi:hypothetical protein